MIAFIIRQGESNITTAVFNSSMVFDLIYKITKDERVAIEVSNWSEVASAGDIYETDNFTVEVIG
jgi:hypothetical protein